MKRRGLLLPRVEYPPLVSCAPCAPLLSVWGGLEGQIIAFRDKGCGRGRVQSSVGLLEIRAREAKRDKSRSMITNPEMGAEMRSNTLRVRVPISSPWSPGCIYTNLDASFDNTKIDHGNGIVDAEQIATKYLNDLGLKAGDKEVRDAVHFPSHIL
ncbi:hypothetical protein B484DRAFT_405018 [Ochromonadaceae sp. CCMP2298]|nr:hypothetical protein B484DRAFT_405018 [Ochromonadaceae sp. CCMP2298]